MRWEGDRTEQQCRGPPRRWWGGGGFGIGGGTVGIGTIVIALLGSWFFGVSPSTILSLLSGGSPAQVQQAPAHPPANDRETRFVRTVLGYTETTWTPIFKRPGRPTSRRSWCCSRAARPDRLRHRQGGRRSVLLPGRPQGVHRPEFFR
jgi:predicted metalloprotease